MLDQYAKLQIAVLVYFVLALPVAIFVCIRQGFGRHAGWLYLLSLTVIRIIGAILRIVAENKPSLGIYIAASIFSAIGLIPLLLCLMGLVKRVNDGTRGTRHPPRFFQVIHIVTLAALALTIAAASETGSTSVSTQNLVINLRKAASILFLVVVVATVGLMLQFVPKLGLVHPGDKIIVTLALVAAPFLIVRVIYTVLISWENNATFNYTTPNIYVEAFMQALMEFIVFACLATAGVIAPPINSEDYIGGGSQLAPKRASTYGSHGGPTGPTRYNGAQY